MFGAKARSALAPRALRLDTVRSNLVTYPRPLRSLRPVPFSFRLSLLKMPMRRVTNYVTPYVTAPLSLATLSRSLECYGVS